MVDITDLSAAHAARKKVLIANGLREESSD